MKHHEAALVIGTFICCIIVLSVVYYSTCQVEPTPQDTGVDWPLIQVEKTDDGQYVNYTVIKTKNLNTDLDNILIRIEPLNGSWSYKAPLSNFSDQHIKFIDNDSSKTLSGGDIISVDRDYWDEGVRFHLHDKEHKLEIGWL